MSMTATTQLDRLNDLVVDLGRSLLQYAQEAWPWTSATDSDALHDVVNRVAREQQESVRELAEFLDAAGVPVDFGVYPFEYTSLHYVSLRYLLDQLVVNAEALTQECQAAAREAADDPEIGPLLARVAAREAAGLAELRALQSRS